VLSGVAAGRWFSPGTLVSSTNKTDHHNTIEILLKVALQPYSCPNLINPLKKLQPFLIFILTKPDEYSSYVNISM
jgi:hypothetical protein